MWNYHDLPISDEIKTFIVEWLPYMNEGPAMEIHSEYDRMMPSVSNPYEFGLLSHLRTLISVIYEYCDGFDVNGESYTPGLDSSDDGPLERHVEMTVTQQMQSHIDLLQSLFKQQRPNALFG